MCGIAGKIYLNKGEVREKDILAMTKKIAHRGPDDEGVFISSDRKVGFGNRRLSIQDLSKNGHMPMTYLARYTITYNGEIYNFKSEREKLRAKGYKFKSQTDTEVILALYDKYGKKCVEHLRGMYSFAIYDSLKNTIFMAVGKLGKKPFKYYWDGNVLIFASELKAIITQKEVKRTVDLVSLHHYFTFGYVFSPRTGFNNIFKLRPGHSLFLDLNDSKLTKEKYYKLDFNNKIEHSEEEWVDIILDKLRESVKLRMVADVPVGAFLSGGVDSSMVVALMAQESKKQIKTFTIGFNEKNMDERVYARKVSHIYNTDHHELTVDKASVELLPDLAYQFEEPYFDPSALVTYLVSQIARKEVKVILNGDGGDENFAGYDRYFRLRRDSMLDPYRWLFLSTLPSVSRASEYLPFLNKGERFLEKMSMPLSDRFTTYNSIFLNSEKKSMYNLIFRDLTKGINSCQIMEDLFDESEAYDPNDRGLYADIGMYLPEDLLVKVDIASMSVSLEGRSPFLDHEFVEMAASIPFNLKLKGNTQKHILKKAAEKLIPNENIYRTKMGFSLPLKEWFSDGLLQYAESLLLNKNAKIYTYLDPKAVRDIVKSHSKGKDVGPKIWSLLTLELWLKEFF